MSARAFGPVDLPEGMRRSRRVLLVAICAGWLLLMARVYAAPVVLGGFVVQTELIAALLIGWLFLTLLLCFQMASSIRPVLMVVIIGVLVLVTPPATMLGLKYLYAGAFLEEKSAVVVRVRDNGAPVPVDIRLENGEVVHSASTDSEDRLGFRGMIESSYSVPEVGDTVKVVEDRLGLLQPQVTSDYPGIEGDENGLGAGFLLGGLLPFGLVSAGAITRRRSFVSTVARPKDDDLAVDVQDDKPVDVQDDKPAQP